MRYFIKLSYKGTAFNGWQSQQNEHSITVQQEITYAIQKLLQKDDLQIVGCGRTDTGVHAIHYIAHFDYDRAIDAQDFIYKMNKFLDKDIVLHGIATVHVEAHARFDAISRSYKYQIHTEKDPFQSNSFYYPYKNLDIDKLNQAAAMLVGKQDFTTFCKINTDVNTKICHIYEAHWTKDGNQYTFHIVGDRFLRGMIRLIVGMCINVSRSKIELKEVQNAMENKQHLDQHWSVPAEGLFLFDIKYPYDLDFKN